MKKERSEGYYWIYVYGKWRIAEWEWGYWTLTGANERIYSDSDFEQICETRIINPYEKV